MIHHADENVRKVARAGDTPDVFTLAISLGNDAMRTRYDIARNLRELASALSDELDGAEGGPIVDDNGNTVGRWALVMPVNAFDQDDQ